MQGGRFWGGDSMTVLRVIVSAHRPNLANHIDLGESPSLTQFDSESFTSITERQSIQFENR